MIEHSRIHLQFTRSRSETLWRLVEEKNFGIEIIDFTESNLMADHGEYSGRIRWYKDNGFWREKMNVTLHGCFHNLLIAATDPDIRSITRTRIEQSLHVAQELGIRKTVFHSFVVPQATSSNTRETLSFHADFWREMLSRFAEIEICIENTWDPNPGFIARLVDAVNDPLFNTCLDVGHIFAWGGSDPGTWLQSGSFSSNISHVHLSDNDGSGDQHAALGSGTIPVREIIGSIESTGMRPTYTLEVGTEANIVPSLEYLGVRENALWKRAVK